jgi:predicted tellurium resistance membrane protein TerC
MNMLMPWAIFGVIVLGMLAIDLGVFHRKAHAESFREAVAWSVVWIAMSLLFNAGVALAYGSQKGMEFLAAYLIEKSLSVDNIFVFVAIFTYFAVDRKYQHRVLFWGIVGALVMRGIFILVGLAIIERFQWVTYLLGGFLVLTGIRFAKEDTEVHPEKIAHWRRQAALHALLPSFGMDYDRNEDTYVTSMGSTTNPTFDRILSATDPSNGVGFSVDWDLGDLIWNNDQTTIDTRSKLMVELRDDIMNEVTRAFFERRRVQMEVLMHPPTDPKREIEQALKLQELTARLDGLTGGWFSEQINGRITTR